MRKGPAEFRAEAASDPKQRTLFGSLMMSQSPATACAKKARKEQLDKAVQCDSIPQISPTATGEDDCLGELINMIVEKVVDKVITKAEAEEKACDRRKSRKKRLGEEKLVEKRRTYDRHERATIIKKMDKPGQTMRKVVKEVKRVKGFESFSVSTAKRMRKMKVPIDICCFLQSRTISIRGGLILVGVGTRDPQGV